MESVAANGTSQLDTKKICELEDLRACRCSYTCENSAGALATASIVSSRDVSGGKMHAMIMRRQNATLFLVQPQFNSPPRYTLAGIFNDI